MSRAAPLYAKRAIEIEGPRIRAVLASARSLGLRPHYGWSGVLLAAAPRQPARFEQRGRIDMAQSNNVSFGNTPQAQADFFASAATGLTDASLGIVSLDVMGNDLGGNAKSLWSVDSGTEATTALEQAALLPQDTARTEGLSTDRSANGAHIWITADGKVGYDASTLSASFRDQLDHISAGQYLTDTFTYAIRLGNGTLSWTTATVQFAGVNRAPVAVADTAAVKEDVTLIATGNVLANDTDVNTSDTHSVTAKSFGANNATDNG